MILDLSNENMFNPLGTKKFYIGKLANSEDPDVIKPHFIRVSTACKDKINIQRKNTILFLEITDCIVFSFMDNSIGIKNWFD